MNAGALKILINLKSISPQTTKNIKEIGVRLGNPYLNSGESLIQTTDRISVNSVSSDLLLTTRRLILVDSTHTQSEPVQIPFTTIMSLRGGWNVDGDPIITLTLTDAGDPASTYPLDLVFSQQAGEHRKEECDGWVEYLMDQIVLARQETIRTDTVPDNQEPGIQPSVRRWVAPEMIQPHTVIAVPRPVPSRDSVTPLQPDSPPVTDNKAESTVSLTLHENEGDEVPDIHMAGIQSNDSDVSAARRIEESTEPNETEQSELVIPVPSDVNRSMAREEGTDESLEKKISSGIQSHESADSLEHVDTHTVSIKKKKELPETMPRLQETITPGTEESIKISAVPEEERESQKPEILHEPEEVRSNTPFTDAIGSPDAILPAEPETREMLPVPEAEPQLLSAPSSHVMKDIAWPIIHINKSASLDRSIPQEPDVGKRDELPEGTAKPELPISPPPSPLPGSSRKMIFVAVAICAIILGVASGAFFYSQYLAGNHTKPPIPEIVPTPTISQTPTIPEGIIPSSGIWVRVESNSTFLGSVGIPGSLKMVSGSGSQLYQILHSDGAVQASFQKQEYTGDPMTVDIYNNGTLMEHHTITAPRGTIDFIIDPKTGNPPGIPSNHT